MRSRHIPFAALLAALAVTTLGLACYNPKVGEGDFLCGSQGACPSGWKCGPDSRCYRSVTTFDANPPDTVRPDLGSDLPTAPPDAQICMRGLTCSAGAPAGRTCDLVCQTGCGCADRCTVAGSEVLCRPITAQPTPLSGSCSPDNDTCGPGAICAPEANFEICGAHCARACRVDADCGRTARCTEGLVDPKDNLLTRFCGPPIEGCNPVGSGGNPPPCLDQQSRPSPGFACYLLDAGKEDSAVCDCAGSLKLGDPCQSKRQCAPGLECLPAGPVGDLRCRQLCTLGVAGGLACPVGVCRALGTSQKIGVCL
jgi:hypothetical protein